MADFVKSGEKMKAAWANQVVTDIRRLQGKGKRRGRFFSSNAASDCPFGILSLSGANYYIEGGLIYCGDKNINVTGTQLTISSSTPRTKLVYFEIPLTVNTDDDDKIILPGIDTTTWTPALEEVDVGTGYPNNTPPTLPAGTGTIIIPLGTLTVSATAWGFVNAGCGNIYVDQCSGVLYFTRGQV